ncbi:MAG: hypothetical protein LBT74_12260 [Acidobacteriota bacterium]|jgi:hypothetical protein|nr:hypothetical protein [Acidobacteriota bacterium]
MKKKSSFKKTIGNAAKVGRDGLDDSPKGTGKAAALRQKERRRLRAQRTARLKKYGALAALGIAATLVVALLLSNRGKPADVGDAAKDAPASYGQSVGTTGAEQPAARSNAAPKTNAAQGDASEDVIEYLKKRGINVEESVIRPDVKGQSQIPANTIRVYRNTAPPPEAEAHPQTDEGDASR